MKAVELHRQIDGAQNPKGFLIAVAARLWRNRRRKYAWRQRIAPLEQLSEQAEQQPAQACCDNPEELALQREQQQLVRQAVSELPDKWKLPVYMYYTAGLSIDEIAGLLRIPAGTVKSRLYKARSVLKEKLRCRGMNNDRKLDDLLRQSLQAETVGPVPSAQIQKKR